MESQKADVDWSVGLKALDHSRSISGYNTSFIFFGLFDCLGTPSDFFNLESERGRKLVFFFCVLYSEASHCNGSILNQ